MTRRVMAIELRRSAAPWIGLLVCVAAWAGSGDPERWTGRWAELVATYRDSLVLLCPFILAAAAWLARRERAARMEDLIESTPRPGWSRVAPRAVVVAGCLGAAYLVGLVASLAETVLAASYRPPGWYWPVVVGALAVVAAALLGLGLGRLLPQRLVPPLLLVLGLAALVTLDLAALVTPDLAGVGRTALLSPAQPRGGDFVAVAGRVNAGQAVWFTAVAAAGFVLLAARRRPWLAGALPVALGLALALPVLPGPERAVRPDAAAGALVCTADLPKVCVTKVYEPVLRQLVGPARSALRKLGRLPDPPTAVVQDTHDFGFPAPQNPANVHAHLTVDRDGTLVSAPDGLEAQLLNGAGTWNCGGHDDASWRRIEAARAVAGAWLDGRTDPPTTYWAPTNKLMAAAWAALRALPADAQLARVAALRTAALNCRADLYEILTAPAGPR